MAIVGAVALFASLLGAVATTFQLGAAARTPGELVRYDFTEGSGTTVGDSGSGTALDLTIADPGNVTWVPGGGLTIDSATVIASAGGATKVVDAVKASGEITVEAWIEPAAGVQAGPARIVSNSPNSKNRNFLLGQGAWSSFPDDVYAARFRTSDNKKGEPTLFSPSGSAVPTQLTHVVLTRDASGTRTIYVDGVETVNDVLAGTTDNWDDSYPLALGNIVSGGRPWFGTLCQVAIYDSALTSVEVGDNFGAGCGAVNTAPILDPVGDQTNDEGDTVSLTVSGSDSDGNNLTFDATDLPDGLSISPIDATSAQITGTITQTAATGSIYPTEITVDDGLGGTDSETINWTVNEINIDPVLDPIGDQSSGEGQTISLFVTANDDDNDNLTFSATGLPPSLSIDTNTGEISGTVDPGTNSYSVTVTVDDGNGGTDAETFNWDVIGNADPELDAVGDQTNDEGDIVSLTVTGSDTDGDPLDFDATGLPDGLSISPIDATSAEITGTITQTAATGSIYTTEITVDDGVGGTDSETINWTVNAVNIDPVLDPIGDQSSVEGATVSLTVTANDDDNDTVTFSATGLPPSLSIDTNTGEISGTVDPGASTYSVTVTVDDGNGGTDSETFDWDVTVVTTPDALVRYDFTEGSGTTVGDSGAGAPLDLTIADAGNVTWIPGGGLTIDAATVIVSAGGATKVVDAVEASGEITVEAWIKPAAGTQDGPARIVSNAPSSKNRNFLLGQGAWSSMPDDVYAARFRTSSSNKGEPTLFSSVGSAVPTVLTHVVLTRDTAGNRTIYVDGVASSTDVLTGTTDNWDDSFPLALANIASGGREWLGTLCEVSIYDNALSASEVNDNFNLGCDLPLDPAAALVQITPGGPIGATTFGNASITVSNTGGPSSPQVTKVEFDLRGSLIPDATFDPIGTAGDEGTQCLAVSVEGSTGFIAPGDPCTDPFSLPHEDSPGVPGNGWDGMELDFDDFGSGESIVFGVDVDPTSIQGVPGSGGAGAVSGLELSGSTVTVTFDDGQVLTGQLFGDTSAGGGEVLVATNFGQVAPTAIEMLGVTTSPTVFPNNSQAGNVPATGTQTVRVSGPDGATVELLEVEGELQSPAPFDEDPFESDAAVAVAYQTGTISGGFVDFTVTLPNADSLYHYVATIDDGATGPLTEQLVIGIGDVDTPVIDPISDVIVNEGDTVTVPVSATDPTGDPITLTMDSTPDITALGAVFTDNTDGTGDLDWLTETGDADTYTVDITASDGTFSSTETFTITVLDPNAGPPAQALVQITPNGAIGATTFGNASITVTNAGTGGAPSITQVSIDLRGSLIPDATFDPIGTAGDEGTQCLAVSAEGGTGFVTPGDPCSDPFSLPHEDSPGVPGNGWDGMTLDFTDFTEGESIVFGVDVDPTTIQGVAGAGGAGAVSGLELSGSSVSVTFSNGQTLTSQLFGDGSAGGGEVLVGSLFGQVAPTAIEMLGVTTSPTVFPNNSQAGNVPATGTQTVRVSGPDGATVELLEVEGELQSPAPFDEDPFESDAAVAVAYQTGTISGGFVDFTVTLPNADSLYHYVATIDDGATGPLTEQLVIGIGDVDTPVIDPISDVAVNEGDTIAIAINSVDPNGDTITLDIASTPDIEALGAILTDNGDGTGSIDWATAAGDAGTYAVDVTATDGVNTATESLTITIIDPNAGPLYRVNSGGPQVAAGDGGIPWEEDQSAAGSPNIGGTAVAGTPSQYLIAGGENAFGTADAIDQTDPSIPAGAVEALFQTEHWDPPAGQEMTYEFPVASGVAYAVDLYFAEIFATAAGVRAFAVEIEGTPVLDNYDIHALVGHDAGIVATFVSPVVTDDALTITFTHQTENPKVNALEVRPTGPPPTDVPPTVGVILDQSVVIGGSLQVPITTTEPDGDVVTLSYSSTPDASSFTTFNDVGDGSGSLTFDPVAGDTGSYDITVTATDVDGSDDETFTLTVNDPPVGGTVFARINSAGPLVTAIDGGPDWEADANPGHAFLTNGGSNGNSGFAAVEPGGTVPAHVPGAIFDTERWSTSGFSYGVPVASGTQVFVRLFLGNGFPGTSTAGDRVFDISIDGTVVENDFDLIPAFGHEVGGMLEYLVTSDGVVDIAFANVVENPLVNGIEVVSATSSPDQLGASPAAVDFGQTFVPGSSTETVTLTNLGFDVGDPAITVTSVAVSGGDFTTDFSGPVTVPAAGSTSFDVTFAPATIGAQSESLTVTHSGSNSPITIPLDGTGSSNITPSFGSSGLSGETLSNPTSLQFGPDGRLYVVQQDGTVFAYTVVRNGQDDYDVTATETINLIKNNTPNHNDDGTTNSTTQRQSTGLLATGTAANPVLYVTSSDWRISVDSDSGLDTNSGVISRLTWNGSSWDKVDIVRGLPRSEENHATNGMALDEGTNTLYVMQGGHANKGAPGSNFSGTPEYFLSAALLSVDLDAIDALPVNTDPRSSTDFVYDLRTLDDPNRVNIDNTHPDFPYPSGHPQFNSTTVDLGDPFGGANGFNQAIPEPGGPVQVYSPGYRNAYDVVLTENGRLYTSDNGPNGGWGGQVIIRSLSGATPTNPGAIDSPPWGDYDLGTEYCTNEFNEDGSNGHGDPLHFIDGAGYYGGHPTPIRGFPALSGVYIYSGSGNSWSQSDFATFESLLPDGLTIANFPDNPIECEYQSDDPGKILDIIGSSTNGITEYTASNFGGAMQGNLLTASLNGNVNRYEMNAAGDAFVSKEVIFSGFGSSPLDVTAQGDTDPFPGTVWAVTHGSNNITVFEPLDFLICTGADDPGLDEDGDGFSNADEIDNGTNPCSAGSAPPDNDGDSVSDLNDNDDDNDGILDVNDPFALDADNGLTTSIPVNHPFDATNPIGGFFEVGFTGLMTNGATDYLDQFDPGNINAGGATALFTVVNVSAGDAHPSGGNSQENAFQYGVDVDSTTAPFVVHSAVEDPFFGGVAPTNFQSMGMFIGTGDQDNYLKVVMNAQGGSGGIEVLQEFGGSPTGISYPVANILTVSSVDLYLAVDPSTLTAQPRVSIDGGTTITDLGSPITLPAAWFDGGDAFGLAVGLISTSSGATPFAATWDLLNVESGGPVNAPPTIDPIADDTVAEDDLFSLQVVATDADPLAYALSGDVPVGMTIDAAGLIEFTPDLDDSGSYVITVEVDDGVNPAVTEDFVLDVTQTDTGTVLSRINLGGPSPDVPALDAGPDWTANPNPNTLPELVGGGGNVFLSSAANGVPVTDITGPTVPASTPIDVFQSERWDPGAAPEMTWNFPVPAGETIEVRIGHAEIFNGVTTPGARLYDVVIDGVTVDTGVDPLGTVGTGAGFVTDYVVTADGDGLDIEFVHVADNPNPKSIEIIQLSTTVNTPPTVDPIADDSVAETTPFSLQVVANDVDTGDTLSYALSGDVPSGMTIDGAGLVSYTPDLTGSGRYVVTVEVDDGVNPAVTEDFTLDVTQTAPLGSAIHRVNVGGFAVAAADSSFPDWAVDTAGNPSPLRTGGSNNIFGPGVGINDITHPTVPGTVPQAVFEVERFDQLGGTEMTWELPVDAGTEVELRLYWAELFSGITAPGQRLIDVEIDGVVVETGVDPYGQVGPGVGYVTDYLVTSDGVIDIVLLHNVENPALKGIEILGVSGVPSVTLVSPADGTTIFTDTVTVEWDLNGFLDPNDHVHVTVDAPPHTSVFRPATSLELTGLTDGTHTITLEVADVGHVVYTNPEASVSFTIDVDLGPVVQDDLVVDHFTYGDALFRVNAGGPAVTAIDGGIDWEIDTAGSPSPYLGGGPANISTTGAGVNLDGSVPASTPPSVFGSERWDPPPGGQMEWNLPVTSGTPVAVRLYFADFNGPTQVPNGRVFDVTVDGQLVLDDYDIFVDAGGNTGVMKEFLTFADGDGVDIDLFREIENPEIRAIEIVELVDATTTAGDVDLLALITNPATNTEDADLTDVEHTLTGPGLPGTPSSIAGSCVPSIAGSLAPGSAIECRFTANITGSPSDVFSSTIDTTGAFNGGQTADVTSAPVTITVPPPITTRVNGGGGTVAATDSGPDWTADGAPLLSVASGSSTGGFAIQGFDGSMPTYAQINTLFTSERWDGSNGTSPDDLTYAIPVSQNGASATVNLFLMNGWPGTSANDTREFDVYIEGVLVLDDFDLSETYGHQMAGMETFNVTDDGDGEITIVFDHGPLENPLVNAIEVIG